MTKRCVVVFAVVVLCSVVGVTFARHYVPSPFASVAIHGDGVVATIRPGVRFALYRPDAHVLKHISGSEPLQLRNGESVSLNSPHTSYEVTCRTSPPPAGLDVVGQWYLHDFPKSFVKRCFVEAK